MNRRAFIVLCGAGPRTAVGAQPASETLAKALHHELPASCEYLFATLAPTTIIATRWHNPAQPAPLGSLVKPFLMLAYAAAHDNQFPTHHCGPSQCWYPPGHGTLTVERALAHSCNSYFTELARNIPTDVLAHITARFGLDIPPDATPGVLIGHRGGCKATPTAIANAYAELAARRHEEAVAAALHGMRLCAREGTASGAHAHIAAKTGTAKCSHPRASAGDGLMAALFPETDPGFVLVLRAHGMPGAEAARLTSSFFRVVKCGRS